MDQPTYNSETKIWSGSKRDIIYNSNIGLGYLILNILKQTPNSVTQVSADTNIETTCHEMRLKTMKIASYLMNCGFKQGDVVGIMASNSENLAPVAFASFTLGMPINPLAPVMTESDIIGMYSKTRPKVVFCDARIVEMVRAAADQMMIRPAIYTLVAKVDGYKFVDDILNGEFDASKFV